MAAFRAASENDEKCRFFADISRQNADVITTMQISDEIRKFL